MMLWVILLATVFLVAVIVYLPYSANLIKYETKPRSTGKPGSSKSSDNNKVSTGYIPPDEVSTGSSNAKASGIGFRKFTKDDIPVQMSLNRPHVKRRRDKVSLDKNPDTYDYDLEDLINESDEEPQPQETSTEGKFSNAMV